VDADPECKDRLHLSAKRFFNAQPALCPVGGEPGGGVFHEGANRQ
jgi:hypothetical protein